MRDLRTRLRSRSRGGRVQSPRALPLLPWGICIETPPLRGFSNALGVAARAEFSRAARTRGAPGDPDGASASRARSRRDESCCFLFLLEVFYRIKLMVYERKRKKRPGPGNLGAAAGILQYDITLHDIIQYAIVLCRVILHYIIILNMYIYIYIYIYM